MARNSRKRGHRSSKMTVPVAVAAPVIIKAYGIGKMAAKGDTDGAVKAVTGVGPDGKFYSQWLVETYGPIAAGYVLHWGASRFGVNKALGRAHIPLIRI